MKIKNETVSLVLILFMFCAICAFILAGINKITAPIILEQEIAKTKEALHQVAPDADDFQAIEFDKATYPYVNEAYHIVENGKNTGVCALVSTNGFGGELKLMVGVDNTGAVLGLNIVDMSETPGLGTKANNPVWLDQFRALVSPIKVVKGVAAGGEVSAVTGATVTSKAIAAGVESAIAFAGGLANE